MSDSSDIEKTIEYQEQILDDLDDIKGSLQEESEYYDEKYQKEVLSSLKSIQKSVESLDESTTIDLLNSFNARYFANSGSSTSVSFSYSTTNIYYLVYDIEGFNNLSFSSSYCSMGRYFTCDDLSTSFTGTIDGCFYGSFTSAFNISEPTHKYLYVSNNGSFSSYALSGTPIPSGGDDPLPEEPVEVVTTSSAVIIEGLENLTQITTFQSFCSSLLIGILLFLVFVKGLRK